MCPKIFLRRGECTCNQTLNVQSSTNICNRVCMYPRTIRRILNNLINLITWLLQRRISHLSPNDISLCTLWNMHVVNLFIWIVLLKFILLVLFLKIPFYYNGQNVYDFLFLWKKRSPENSRERERERNNCFWEMNRSSYAIPVSCIIC